MTEQTQPFTQNYHTGLPGWRAVGVGPDTGATSLSCTDNQAEEEPDAQD